MAVRRPGTAAPSAVCLEDRGRFDHQPPVQSSPEASEKGLGVSHRETTQRALGAGTQTPGPGTSPLILIH